MSENEIRISAASLARIEIDGKYLLALNKSRLKAGKKVYTPFGGALEFYEEARPYLESLGAKFENGNDLRLTISEKNLPEFEKWFYQRKEREVSVDRELKEEFVDEEKVLSILPEGSVKINYLQISTERANSSRPGQEGTPTQRYLEIYKAEFSAEYVEMIKNNLKNPDTKLILASKEEIETGKTYSGIEIATNCLPLINEVKFADANTPSK